MYVSLGSPVLSLSPKMWLIARKHFMLVMLLRKPPTICQEFWGLPFKLIRNNIILSIGKSPHHSGRLIDVS